MDIFELSGLRLIHIEDFEEPYTMSADEREAYRRRFRTLFLDEGSARRGGLGHVARVTNAQGDTLALKTLVLPRDEASDGKTDAHRETVLRAAFDEEYRSHRALSGIKGFPRLYGRGTVEGAPALIMEWIEGESLASARRRLFVPGYRAVAPFTAASFGRDLFDLLRRMRLVGNGFVHRDISPANIMIRTDLRSVERQADEGSFDLVLVDFGSSAQGVKEGGSVRLAPAHDVRRRATPAYAAPEMMLDGLDDADARRCSGAVDVYEAASVLYELLCGEVPFCEHDHEELFKEGARHLCERKLSEVPAYPVSVHGACEDMRPVLAAEPRVALPLGEAALQLGVTATSERVRSALVRVDDGLARVVLACLDARQEGRPTAEAAYELLQGFCSVYVQNAVRALRGERLLSFADLPAVGAEGLPWGPVRALCIAAGVIAAAAGTAIAVRTSVALAGAETSISLGDLRWGGGALAQAVFLLLVVPGLAGYIVRGSAGASRDGFARATFTSAAFFTIEVLAVAAGVVHVAGASADQLAAALFAINACGWCPMVLRFVLNAPAAHSVKMSARGDTVTRIEGGAYLAVDSAAITLPLETSRQDVATANRYGTDAPHGAGTPSQESMMQESKDAGNF